MDSKIIENLLNSIPSVNNRDYWFIRTDSGDSFDYFLEQGIVGIGWNAITLHDLRQPENVTKAKINRIYYRDNHDYNETAKKRQTSSAYNKLQRFADLKKGDVVIVPGEGSSELAFGIINDHEPFNSSEEGLQGYENIKRRKVIWKKRTWVGNLDNVFWMVKSNMHSLSSVNKYSDYIDSVLDELYLKEDRLHQVINVRTTGEINFNKLTELLELHKELLTDINSQFNCDELDQLANSNIKLNLNSPGIINVAVPKGAVGILFSFLMTFTSCEDTSQFGEYEQIGDNINPELREKFERYQEIKEEFDADNQINYFAEE